MCLSSFTAVNLRVPAAQSQRKALQSLRTKKILQLMIKNVTFSPASVRIMKLSLATVLTLLGLLVVGPSSAAAQENIQTELGLHMEDLNTPWRRLRRQVNKPEKNASSLALVAEMRAAAVAASSLIPARTAGLPESQREGFLVEYEAGMKKLVELIDAIAVALKSGDNETATAIVGEINDFRRDAHERFKADD